MKTRLMQAGLWQSEEGEPELNINLAWRVLSRLGYPGRYAGKTQDGGHEYLIVSAETGEYLTSGKGFTLERAMCEAALNASSLVKPKLQH